MIYRVDTSGEDALKDGLPVLFLGWALRSDLVTWTLCKSQKLWTKLAD